MAGGTPGTGNATRAELEAAWVERLFDARVLHEAGRYATSIVHGYYALEILLKARVCRLLDLDELLQEFQKHNLDYLLRLSGLHRRLTNDPVVSARWEKVTKFDEKRINRLRYGQESARKADSGAFHRSLWAIASQQWKDNPYGVIPWITRQP